MPPFDNKTKYDPGRFRFAVTFYNEVSTKNRSGGQEVALVPYFSTKAVKEKLREGSQLVINAGASTLNDDCYFVIRNRCGLRPTKAMKVLCDDIYYTIAAIIEIDVPVNYIKLLCKKAK